MISLQTTTQQQMTAFTNQGATATLAYYDPNYAPTTYRCYLVQVSGFDANNPNIMHFQGIHLGDGSLGTAYSVDLGQCKYVWRELPSTLSNIDQPDPNSTTVEVIDSCALLFLTDAYLATAPDSKYATDYVPVADDPNWLGQRATPLDLPKWPDGLGAGAVRELGSVQRLLKMYSAGLEEPEKTKFDAMFASHFGPR